MKAAGLIRPPPVAMAGKEGVKTVGWRSMPDENPSLLPAMLRNTV